MLAHELGSRVIVAAFDLAGRERLERNGFWMERGSPQGYVMRRDFRGLRVASQEER